MFYGFPLLFSGKENTLFFLKATKKQLKVNIFRYLCLFFLYFFYISWFYLEIGSKLSHLLNTFSLGFEGI